MPVYTCIAKDRNGNTLTDLIEAENEEGVIERLHSRELVVISIREKGKALKEKVRSKFFISKNSLKGKVKLGEILLFTNQLSVMIDGGLHLMDCLHSLSKECSKKLLGRIIQKVREDVRDGSTLYDAMKKHPSCFSNLYLGMVKAGENSGELALVLTQLSEYLERSDSLRRKVKSATTYPKFMISFAFLCFLVLLTWVIPTFKKLYSRSKQGLPLPTEILLGVSDFFRVYFIPIFLISGVIFFLLYSFFRKNEKGALLWDKFLLRIPVFGSLNTKAIMSRFSRTMGVMIKSGLPIIDSLDIASEVANNKVIKIACQDVAVKVKEGSSLAKAMTDNPIFPEMIVQMVYSGEQVGSIEKMLIKASDFYDRQVDATLSSLTSLLEPFLIVAVGGVLSLVIIAVFLPIFNLGKAIR